MSSRNIERSYSRHGTGYGRSRYYDDDYHNNYRREMLDSLRRDYERNRLDSRANTETGGVKPIEVSKVEFYAADNATEHHTSRYDLISAKKPAPVLRRGFPFYVGIRFQRQYDPNKDSVKLEFFTGSKPSLGKGTLVQLPITTSTEFTKDEKKKWDVRVNYNEANDLHIQVQIPSSVGIGIWRARVITQDRKRSAAPVQYNCKDNIYILFNPWDKDDAVYMDNENGRKEYVLNDVGKIFVGAHSSPKGRKWIYGQYEDAVLPACMYLLELTGLDYTSRANPTKIVRAVAAAVNSNDDNGVLIGNWSGKYEDGTEPWLWTGSAAILEKFMEKGGRSVRYGQCWVFAGVTTTVCRALGIPCRTVTNFISAHDTDETMTIDSFYDKNGDEIKGTGDSVWNFHVWNDCWMSRPDLPSGYGGWQAIDATPQETSEGIYRAGPSSLVAIRRGEIGYLYDTPFIFSEVNADVVHWQRDESSDLGWKQIYINKYHVGRLICTKAVDKDDDYGEDDMEVILDEYKKKEGTREERMTVRNAISGGGLNYLYDIPAKGTEDVTLDLVDLDKVMIGKPFLVTVNLENKSSEVRTIWAVLSASSVYYTGITASKLKRVNVEFVLKPRQVEVLQIEVKPEEYLDKLVDYSMIKIYAIATIKETKQTWSEEDDFQVEKPKLGLEVSEVMNVKKEYILKLSFTNPLDKTLTDCTVSVECPGIAPSYRVDVSDVKPNGTFVHEEKLTPQKAGKTKLLVIFNSRQLNEIMGSKQVKVEL